MFLRQLPWELDVGCWLLGVLSPLRKLTLQCREEPAFLAVTSARWGVGFDTQQPLKEPHEPTADSCSQAATPSWTLHLACHGSPVQQSRRGWAAIRAAGRGSQTPSQTAQPRSVAWCGGGRCRAAAWQVARRPGGLPPDRPEGGRGDHGADVAQPLDQLGQRDFPAQDPGIGIFEAGRNLDSQSTVTFERDGDEVPERR